jgi:hypothetical protein
VLTVLLTVVATVVTVIGCSTHQGIMREESVRAVGRDCLTRAGRGCAAGLV